MKAALFFLALVTSSLSHAQTPWKLPEPGTSWKLPEPEMSKAPPSELDKAIAKLTPAKLPAKKKAAPKKKPGASIGMTKKQVINETDWGRPNSIQVKINRDGRWEFWDYGNDNELVFLDGELFEINVTECSN